MDPLPQPFVNLVETVTPRHGRPIRSRVIAYSHDGAPLEGDLVEPAGDSEGGAGKAVLIFHAWMGIGDNVRMRAQMIARLGYTAFAADVYGAGVRPQTPPEMKAEAEKYYADLNLMRGRAQAAFDVLLREGFAAADIVVIGYCFGGTVALEHAFMGQPSAGVVSFHGRLLTHKSPEAAAVTAPLLILTGGDDDIVPDSEINAFADELRTAPDLDWQIAIYAGAPHAFTVPGPMYQHRADTRSWRAFVDFLDEVAPLS